MTCSLILWLATAIACLSVGGKVAEYNGYRYWVGAVYGLVFSIPGIMVACTVIHLMDVYRKV